MGMRRRPRAMLPIPEGTKTRQCVRCHEPMAIGKKTPTGVRRHVARELCNGCYPTEHKSGRHTQHRRGTRPAGAWVDEVANLLAAGQTITAAADAVGTTRTTLSSALHRARAGENPGGPRE
jgi:hypothetical protein